MSATITISVGAAELRALKKVLASVSAGGHVVATAKERVALCALYRRLTQFD